MSIIETLERETYTFRLPQQNGVNSVPPLFHTTKIISLLFEAIPDSWFACGWVNGFLNDIRRVRDVSSPVSLVETLISTDYNERLISLLGNEKKILIDHGRPMKYEHGDEIDGVYFQELKRDRIHWRYPRYVHFGNAGYDNKPISLLRVLGIIEILFDLGYEGAFGISAHGVPDEQYNYRASTHIASVSVFAGGWSDYGCWRLPLPPAIMMSFYPERGGRLEDISSFLRVCEQAQLEQLGEGKFRSVRI